MRRSQIQCLVQSRCSYMLVSNFKEFAGQGKSDQWHERGPDKELLELRDELCYRYQMGLPDAFSWHSSFSIKEAEDLGT